MVEYQSTLHFDGNNYLGGVLVMDKGKKIGLQMSLLMSVTLSLCLSFTGLLFAGDKIGEQLSLPALLINFAVSFGTLRFYTGTKRLTRCC